MDVAQEYKQKAQKLVKVLYPTFSDKHAFKRLLPHLTEPLECMDSLDALQNALNEGTSESLDRAWEMIFAPRIDATIRYLDEMDKLGGLPDETVQAILKKPGLLDEISDLIHLRQFDAIPMKLKSNVPSTQRASQISRSGDAHVHGHVRDVYQGWTRDYVGSGVERFMETLTGNNNDFSPSEIYARFIPIIQSSGTGKSRLIDQFSMQVPGIMYTCRRVGDRGFPSGDDEIRDYLQYHLKTPDENKHFQNALTKVVALFAATVTESQYNFCFDWHLQLFLTRYSRQTSS
jgi:hypothetical protein